MTQPVSTKKGQRAKSVDSKKRSLNVFNFRYEHQQIFGHKLALKRIQAEKSKESKSQIGSNDTSEPLGVAQIKSQKVVTYERSLM